MRREVRCRPRRKQEDSGTLEGRGKSTLRRHREAAALSRAQVVCTWLSQHAVRCFVLLCLGFLSVSGKLRRLRVQRSRDQTAQAGRPLTGRGQKRGAADHTEATQTELAEGPRCRSRPERFPLFATRGKNSTAAPKTHRPETKQRAQPQATQKRAKPTAEARHERKARKDRGG